MLVPIKKEQRHKKDTVYIYIDIYNLNYTF